MGMTLQLLDTAGDQFMHDLLWLTVIIVSIAGALMTLYAVYIGYLFFTATDANRRKAAKDRAIKVVASTLIVFALVFVLQGIEVSFATDFVWDKSNNSAPSTTNIECKYAGSSVELKIYGDVNGGEGLHGDFKILGTNIHVKSDKTNGYTDIKSALGAEINYVGFQVSGFNYKLASTNNDASAQWMENLTFEVNGDDADFHFGNGIGHVPCCFENPNNTGNRYVTLKIFFKVVVMDKNKNEEEKRNFLGTIFSIDVKLKITPMGNATKWLQQENYDATWN